MYHTYPGLFFALISISRLAHHGCYLYELMFPSAACYPGCGVQGYDHHSIQAVTQLYARSPLLARAQVKDGPSNTLIFKIGLPRVRHLLEIRLDRATSAHPRRCARATTAGHAQGPDLPSIIPSRLTITASSGTVLILWAVAMSCVCITQFGVRSVQNSPNLKVVHAASRA